MSDEDLTKSDAVHSEKEDEPTDNENKVILEEKMDYKDDSSSVNEETGASGDSHNDCDKGSKDVTTDGPGDTIADVSSQNCGKNENSGPTCDDSSKKRSDFDQSSVIYEGDKCIYIDPSTKYRYVWDNNKNDWIAEQQLGQPGQDVDYVYDGSTYTYVDKSTSKFGLSVNYFVVLP